jgi:hypothetical protein|tara:strand:- start:112 stop:1863 length:1752 start_codon:yes stop_codon:yes gene_type:complete
MKIDISLVYALLFLWFGHGFLYAQDDTNEDLSTQEVLVVKSYTPSLSDAFKITEGPKIPDSLKATNKTLIYKIIPIDVVSTFEPNKATPLKLKKRSSSTPYNTFFSGGFGSKSQLYLNISSVIELDRTQRFGLNVYRDGFGSDVGNSLLKSSQSFSQFGAHHNLRSNNYNVNTQLQFTAQKNNYFGLYDRNWDDFLIGSLTPEVKRNYFKFRTYWDWFDSFLRSLSFQANITSDNFTTSEQQLNVKADFTAPFAGGKFQANTEIQGQNSLFSQPFFENQTQEFTQGIGKVGLEWLYNENDLKLKIGAGVAYFEGDESLSSKLNYYPEIEVFYQKKGNSIAPYLTASGGVRVNSYRETAIFNPYIAPITELRPTFNRYNAMLGIRSSVSSVLNFNFGLLYDQVENYQFYQRLPLDIKGSNDAYRLSNSFENKYANVDLYGVKARLRIDLAKNNFVHFETVYRHFELTDDQVMYNIPALQMNWKSQFKFKDILTLAFNGEVWGNRSALEHIILQDQANQSIYPEEISLPLFLRSSAHLTIKLNEQFDAFVKGRFSNSDIHGQWGYFQEPSLLLLGGVTYKFDFQY